MLRCLFEGQPGAFGRTRRGNSSEWGQQLFFPPHGCNGTPAHCIFCLEKCAHVMYASVQTMHYAFISNSKIKKSTVIYTKCYIRANHGLAFESDQGSPKSSS